MAAVPVPQTPTPTLRVVAAILGNALEFYYFTVYAAFAAVIGRAFFPAAKPNVSLLLSVTTFGIGFIARPLGGILIGAYADRFGRKPAMTLTIWLMAKSTHQALCFRRSVTQYSSLLMTRCRGCLKKLSTQWHNGNKR